MESGSIAALHRGKTGKVSDKWSSYLAYYDRLFLPWRDNPVRLLEIGVQNGGSLETWARYFHAAAILVGCDIDPRCAALRYEDPRITVVVGDANGEDARQRIAALAPQFDIVIDDGSHRSADIIQAFVGYFPRLAPGGVYVVEDTHCLYMDDFGGGLLNEAAAHAFFKRLTDVVNFQFWSGQATLNTHLHTFFGLKETPAFILDGWIDAIEFRNSLIVVHKAGTPGHDKLGDRVMVGSVAQVQTWGGLFGDGSA